MKERAFNARTDDVRAILAGATVFRRLLTKLPANRSDMAIHHIGRCHYSGRWTFYDENNNCHSCNGGIRSPFGAPGDRLWIRETWAPVPTPGGYGCAPDACEREAMRIYRADGDRADLRQWSDGSPRWDGRWRSASAMPRWASRLVLEVAGVEVEKGPEGWFWVVNFRRADG